MEWIIFPIIVLACFGLYWLRVFPFREKPAKEPELTANAKLTAKEVISGANRTGRSSGLGFNYVLTFQTDEGEELKLYSHDYEYGALREGMTGSLTWKGRYYVSFKGA